MRSIGKQKWRSLQKIPVMNLANTPTVMRGLEKNSYRDLRIQDVLLIPLSFVAGGKNQPEFFTLAVLIPSKQTVNKL